MFKLLYIVNVGKPITPIAKELLARESWPSFVTLFELRSQFHKQILSKRSYTALSLDVSSHMTLFSQSECIITA